jgi:hypothetical protein
VPDGIIAEADMVTVPTFSEFKGLTVTSDRPDIVQEYVADTARVIAVAVESDDPDIEVGSESRFAVDREGRTEDEIREAIRSCPGPKRGRVAKALGLKGTCQAVTIVRHMRT